MVSAVVAKVEGGKRLSSRPFLGAKSNLLCCPKSSGAVRQPVFHLPISNRESARKSSEAWVPAAARHWPSPLTKAEGLAERDMTSRLVLDDLDLVLELVLEFHVSRIGSVDDHLQVAMRDIIASLGMKSGQSEGEHG